MFSDNYIVYDKFSIFNREYISTGEVMPWRFTSLYDSAYLPDIDEKVADKLKLFFRYRYAHATENLFDEFKNLIIEHRNGEPLEYRVYNVMKYSTVNGHISFWKHFVSSICCDELNICQEKIDAITNITDEMATDITHLSYDLSGKLKSVTVYDRSFNLEKYQITDPLKKVDEMCADKTQTFRSIVTVYPDSNKFLYHLMLNYAPYSVYPYREVEKRTHEYGVVSHTNKFHNERFKKLFLENRILSQDQIDYIDTIIQDNTRFELEFDVNEDGSLNDIHLLHFRIYEFKDLTSA